MERQGEGQGFEGAGYDLQLGLGLRSDLQLGLGLCSDLQSGLGLSSGCVLTFN